MSYQGMSYQGMSYQGMSYQGMSYQGMSYQGMSYQGMSYQGMSYQGVPLRGVDRIGKLGPEITLLGLEVPSRTDQLGVPGLHAVVAPNSAVPLQGIQVGPRPASFREINVDPD